MYGRRARVFNVLMAIKQLIFNSFEQNNQGLRSNSTDLIVDSSGKTWINAAGLCYYDDAKGKFTYINPDPRRQIGGMDYRVLNGNDLWYAGSFGLSKINLKSPKRHFYTSLKNIGNSLGNFFIGDNTLLVSSREKVFFYNIKKDTYTTKTFLYNHSLLKIFTAITSGGITYLGTNHGLFTLSDDFNSVTPLVTGVADLIDDFLFMPQDKAHKYLFIATDGSGVQVYNTFNKKLEAYLHT